MPSKTLQITREQMDAMAAPRRALLPPKIARYLRDECAKQVGSMNDDALLKFSREQMERAGGHGVDVEWDVCRYAWLASLHGPKFDEECSWARQVLGDTALSGTERLDLLERHQTNYIDPMFNPA